MTKELVLPASVVTDSTLPQAVRPPPVDFASPHYRILYTPKRKPQVDLTPRVVSVKHKDTSGRQSPTVELTLDNADEYLMSWPDLWLKGSVIQVTYGYPGAMRDAGEFVTKEYKGNSKTVSITAYEAKRNKVSRKPNRRTWKRVTRSQAVRDVLSAAGITNDVLFIEDTDQVIESITQTESDWPFCKRMADLEGRAFYASPEGIYWVRSNHQKAPTHLFRHVKGVVGADMILDYEVESFGANLPGKIKLRGRDPITKRPFEVYADDEAVQELDPIVVSQDFVTPEEGDREDQGNDGYEIVSNVGSRSEAEAKRLADMLYKEYRHSAAKLTLKLCGDPTVRLHSMIMVWGIGPVVDGIYQVKEAEHDLSKSGYTTNVKVGRDGLAAKPTSTSGINWNLFLGGKDRWTIIPQSGAKEVY